MNRDKDFLLRNTNGRWNSLYLNTGWSVGYVSDLINRRSFKNFQEWVDFYLSSGQERKEKIAQLPQEYQDILNKHTISYNERQSLPSELMELNTKYGRTKEDLIEKAQVLLDSFEADGNINNFTLDEMKYTVGQRVVCDVYNGIVERERNTIKTMEWLFPSLDFKQLIGKDDADYAVDYEVYCDGKLVCGLQIKPVSYLSDKPYLRESKAINKFKNDFYTLSTGVPVFYIYSQKNGAIHNRQIVEEVNSVIPSIHQNICKTI